jgi:hypothetical protein
MGSIFHRLTSIWAGHYRSKFVKSSHDLEAVQSDILRAIVAQIRSCPAHLESNLSEDDDWYSFSQKVEPTSYSDWQHWIEKGLNDGSNYLSASLVERHQPTSGSTSNIKWIPYTKKFLSEINSALMPWIADIYQRHPGVSVGKHYWSISWIPTDLRKDVDDNVNDDLKILPWWERVIAERYMAVPESVARAESSDDTLFANLAWLVACEDLSFLSIWSPTFALSLIEAIGQYRFELVEVLERGDWQARSASLKLTPCPRAPRRAALLRQCDDPYSKDFLYALWPKLALISCWDTASSKVWADRLGALFPHAAVEGKGLWATEGAVTIPFQGRYPLAATSHFYEFLDLESDQIVPSWKLEKGMMVSPLISSGAGLLRYRLNDRLEVTGHFNQLPCFEFKGRLDGTDLAGEKMGADHAQDILRHFAESNGVVAISLLAVPGQSDSDQDPTSKGRYVLLCEPGSTSRSVEELETLLDTELKKHFHYQLARDLKQLDHPCVLLSKEAMDIYHFRCKARGMATGNIKVEPLVLWNTPLHSTMIDRFQNRKRSQDTTAD